LVTYQEIQHIDGYYAERIEWYRDEFGYVASDRGEGREIKVILSTFQERQAAAEGSRNKS
jgi:hypothetical protein